MSLTGLRVLVGVLLLLAVVVGSLPLLILLDLAAGGTGYGLCPGRLSQCRNPFTAAPELSFALMLALFALVASIRVAMRTMRRMERLEGYQQQARLSGRR